MKKGKTMKNRTTIILVAFAASVLPIVCLGNTPQVVKSAPLKPKVHHVKNFVKASQTRVVPHLGTLAHLRGMDPNVAQTLGDSFSFSRTGDKAILLRNWAEARADYQNALSLIPTNPQALYGMAQCAEATGETSVALSYYRQEVYSHDGRYGTVPGDGFQDNDIKRLMQFALLLDKSGQANEGMFIYNRAASLMDFQDGDPHKGKQASEVLLPELLTEPVQSTQVEYTATHLKALAYTALANEEMKVGSDKEARAHMQEAARLYPDSPVTQYYLGEALADTYYHTAEHPVQDKVGMAAAYKKAVELGDDKTAAAAKERLSMYP